MRVYAVMCHDVHLKCLAHKSCHSISWSNVLGSLVRKSCHLISCSNVLGSLEEMLTDHL